MWLVASAWRVVPALLRLRDEFDQLAPDRDRGADGTIGDTAHKARSSDHNPDDTAGSATPHTDTDTIAEVHALDVDSSGPWPAGMTMPKAVAVVVARMNAMDTPAPVSYVIWDHHIYESPDWAERPYDGTDPHTGHAHFGARYGSGAGASNPENYDGSFGLLEAFTVAHDPLDTADCTKLWGTDIIPNPDQRNDSPGHTPPGTNPTTGAAFAVGDIWQLLYNLYDEVQQVKLTGQDTHARVIALQGE